MRTQSVPFGKCFLHSLKNYKVCILYSFLCLATDKITNRKLWNFTAKLVLSQICLTRYFTQLQSRLQAPIKICCLLHRKKNKIFCFLLKETFFSPARITNNVNISTWFSISDIYFHYPSLKFLSGCICRRLSQGAQMFGTLPFF